MHFFNVRLFDGYLFSKWITESLQDDRNLFEHLPCILIFEVLLCKVDEDKVKKVFVVLKGKDRFEERDRWYFKVRRVEVAQIYQNVDKGRGLKFWSWVRHVLPEQIGHSLLVLKFCDYGKSGIWRCLTWHFNWSQFVQFTDNRLEFVFLLTVNLVKAQYRKD